MTNPRSMDDAGLINEFRQGDESAFDVLFDRYRDGVYSLAYRTLGPAGAEDAAQDAFVQLYKSLHRFRGDAKFRTWLFRLTLNVCRDHIRRRAKQPILYDDIADIDGAVSLDNSASSRQDDVESAVFNLAEDERSLLELHYIQGFSYREISEIIGSNDCTVRTRIHRAILKLRRRLLPEREAGKS